MAAPKTLAPHADRCPYGVPERVREGVYGFGHLAFVHRKAAHSRQKPSQDLSVKNMLGAKFTRIFARAFGKSAGTVIQKTQ